MYKYYHTKKRKTTPFSGKINPGKKFLEKMTGREGK